MWENRVSTRVTACRFNRGIFKHWEHIVESIANQNICTIQFYFVSPVGKISAFALQWDLKPLNLERKLSFGTWGHHWAAKLSPVERGYSWMGDHLGIASCWLSNLELVWVEFLVSPVFWGFFSGFSGFPPIKSTARSIQGPHHWYQQLMLKRVFPVKIKISFHSSFWGSLWNPCYVNISFFLYLKIFIHGN